MMDQIMNPDQNWPALLKRIVQARAGGAVERCHAIRHIGSYSDAAHSWGVAMLMLQLWPEDFPRLAAYCLTHDVAEAWVGDIPAPAVRHVPGLGDAVKSIEEKLCHSLGLPSENDLSGEDYLKLKTCDRLEFLFWANEQVLLGNQFALDALIEVRRYLSEVELPEPAAQLFAAMDHPTSATPSLLPVQQGVVKKVVENGDC